MSNAAFESEIAKVNNILCAVNLLTWDSRVMMPPGGVDARGRQIATLVSLDRDLATGDGNAAGDRGRPCRTFRARAGRCLRRLYRELQDALLPLLAQAKEANVRAKIL